MNCVILEEMRFYVQSRHKNRHPLVLPRERRKLQLVGEGGGGSEGEEEEEGGESEKAMRFLLVNQKRDKRMVLLEIEDKSRRN